MRVAMAGDARRVGWKASAELVTKVTITARYFIVRELMFVIRVTGGGIERSGREIRVDERPAR